MPVQPQSEEQRKIREWKPKATPLSSRQLRGAWPQKVKDEALFSARTTHKTYIDMVKKRLAEVAAGTLVPKAAEERLQETLASLGYDPQRGFPGNKSVPPARPKSIEDLSSSARIQLIIDTNVKRARSMGQMAASEEPQFMLANPAWRLTRTGARKKPRGDWRRRWAEAGAACGWEGAAQRQMVALKTSPIWNALGEGAGGYEDALGSPFPPFAFGSGMAWVNVSGREWQNICKAEGIDDGMAEIREKAVERRREEARAEGVEPATEREKRLLREMLAKMRKRREERERGQGAVTTEEPIPPPPYAEQRPEPPSVKAASRSVLEARRRVLAARGRAESLYLPAVEKAKRRLEAVAEDGGVDAEKEREAVGRSEAYFREAVRTADAALAYLARYEGLMRRAASGGYGDEGRFRIYSDAARKTADRAEAALKYARYWEGRAARAVESVEKRAKAEGGGDGQ